MITEIDMEIIIYAGDLFHIQLIVSNTTAM